MRDGARITPSVMTTCEASRHAGPPSSIRTCFAKRGPLQKRWRCLAVAMDVSSRGQCLHERNRFQRLAGIRASQDFGLLHLRHD